MTRNDRYYNGGVRFTSDCFLLDSLMFFRKLREEILVSPVGNWTNAPVSVRRIQSSSFHYYNLQTLECKDIEGTQFYRALKIFRDNGGLSKIDEEYMYDKVLENDFVMYCLFTSDHM